MTHLEFCFNVKMQVTIIYAISYASAIGFLIAWKLSQCLTPHAREYIFTFCSKWLFYTVCLRRLNGSSDVTIMTGSIIMIFIIANVVGCAIGVHNQSELSLRLARMSVTNLMILYLGGSSNLLVEQGLRISNAEQQVLHRWIGRIMIVEGLTHGTLSIIKTEDTTNAIDLALYILLSVIALLSVIYVRRRMYEIFTRSHSLASIGILVLLWFHVSHVSTYVLICLVVPAALFLIQRVGWLLYLLHRNASFGPRTRAVIDRFPSSSPSEEVMQVRIDVKRPWALRPGQFVYISLPRLRTLGLGILESHPFMVAWSAKKEDGQLGSIVLLVQSRGGFTRRLQLSESPTSAILDGPYGCADEKSLGSYDKVLLMSCGIGLASHLSTAQYLLLAHNQQTARIRRLTMVWLLETPDQLRWAAEFLCALDDIDTRQILTIFLFYPSDTEGSSEGRKTKFFPPRHRMLSLPGNLDMPWLIEREWGAEAGNMLVTVCGNSTFELCARKAVRSSVHPIDFKNSLFQPDEPGTSVISSARYS